MNLSQFNRILLQSLLLPVVALAFVAAVLLLQIRSSQNTVATIQATADSINAATRIQALVIDQEAGLRGFQITHDTQFLDPYYKAETPLSESINELRANLVAHGEDGGLVDSIQAAYVTWRVSFAQPLISTIEAGGEAHDVALNLQGKQQMDNLRARIRDLIEDEAATRNKEIARWRNQVRHTYEALVLLALSAGAFISVFTYNRMHRVSDAYQGTLDGLRRHAQATFESEERLRTTLTSIGDGVILCDADGNVEILNTVAQELTGWSQEEAFRKPLNEIFEIVNEQTREPVENPVAKAKRLKRVVGLANHTVLIRRDRSELHIDDSGAPIYDRSGTLTGVVMVFRDITLQRQSQNALLATEKLATAGRLAATIAHEMHNPLDSVVNLLYLIRDEKDPAVSGTYLDLAQQELGRMGQVSRAMLGLYREAKAPVRIDVKEMLESVLVLLDRQLKSLQVDCVTTLSENLLIEGFPAELRQVFTNLIVNAAEAASPHGHLTVKARNAGPGRTGSGAGRNGAIFEIGDNGTGIDADSLKRIFEPFFTTKGERGTGIGLWVSRGIIDKHGGTIDIRSSTGADDHGTTITIFLPRIGATPPPVKLP